MRMNSHTRLKYDNIIQTIRPAIVCVLAFVVCGMRQLGFCTRLHYMCVCVCADKARGFAYVSVFCISYMLICRRRFCLSGLSHATLIYQCLVIVHANVDCMNRCNRECQTLEHTFHAFLSYAPIFLFFAARKTNKKPFPLSLEEKIYDFL